MPDRLAVPAAASVAHMERDDHRCIPTTRAAYRIELIDRSGN
jgi:hypothetical protein